MNLSIVRRILGYVLLLEGMLMLLPCVVALVYGESQGITYLIIASVVLALGGLTVIKKPKSNVFYLKEGCVATALSWIVLSVFGALPFYFTGEISNPVDALFETISGFTTTGASILNDVEALSHTALFWRSFTHWIGGMGVLVFLMAVIQMAGGSNINLMKAESPGPSVGKIVPKMRQTAGTLYIIYFVLTVLEILLLCFGDMPIFDAVTTSLGTAGTGGFGIKNDSIGGYSMYSQWVVTVFMLLFGVNFNAYYFLLLKEFKKARKMDEVRAYFVIVFFAILIILADVINVYDTFGEALSKSAFQVASIITTTGFSTADFNQWATSSKFVIVVLMFIGACAGSTGGGIKVSRFVVVGKTVFKEISSYLHPKSVKKITLDGRPIERETIRTTNVYFITFIAVFVGSMFVVSFENIDLTSTFTAVAATINNIGPGLELVGPTRNFADFSILSKFILMFDMLAGRLELFPLLILFSPMLWKEGFQEKTHRSFK